MKKKTTKHQQNLHLFYLSFENTMKFLGKLLSMGKKGSRNSNELSQNCPK